MLPLHSICECTLAFSLRFGISALRFLGRVLVEDLMQAIWCFSNSPLLLISDTIPFLQRKERRRKAGKIKPRKSRKALQRNGGRSYRLLFPHVVPERKLPGKIVPPNV